MLTKVKCYFSLSEPMIGVRIEGVRLFNFGQLSAFDLRSSSALKEKCQVICTLN